MQPGDRLICAFEKPPELGGRFSEWPLHVTVLSWFRCSLPSSRLARLLELNLKGFEPFRLEVGNEAQFGPRQNVLVNLVKTSPQLDAVEEITRLALENSDIQFASKQFSKYRPHITVQERARLRAGDNFIVRQLSIIEQKVDYKEVVGAARLGT